MTGGQLLDFEVIKRKYANMMDIITYDDLLRRLNNTIVALTSDTKASQPKPQLSGPHALLILSHHLELLERSARHVDVDARIVNGRHHFGPCAFVA